MDDFWRIVSSVLGVAGIIGTGACARYFGWLSKVADQSLAKLCTHVLLPCYLASRIIANDQIKTIDGLWIPATFGFCTTAFGLFAAYAFARRLGKWFELETDGHCRAFALCAGICNYGYMPLPLAESMFPDAVVDLILHNVGVELALWTIGIAIIRGQAGGGFFRSLVSPPMISVIVAISIKHLQLEQHIPNSAMYAITSLGNCAIPIGLLLSGAIIVDFVAQTSGFGSAKAILACVGIRQFVMPVFILSAAYFFAEDLTRGVQMKQVLMLQAAMPAAIFPIVLVRLYEGNTPTALRVVLSTSLAGVVLIPIWISIGQLILF